MGQMAAAIEKNLEGQAAEAGEDEDDEEDIDDAPIFTPELARLRAKEQGKPLPDNDNDIDMDANEDGEEAEDGEDV